MYITPSSVPATVITAVLIINFMRLLFIGDSREKFISDAVWKNNKESIQRYLNIYPVFPLLVQANIVPRDAQEAYVDITIKPDKRNLIIDSIPKCEQDDYLVRFIECLKNTYEEAGPAHEELVKLLERDYEAMKIDPTLTLPDYKAMKIDPTLTLPGINLILL